MVQEIINNYYYKLLIPLNTYNIKINKIHKFFKRFITSQKLYSERKVYKIRTMESRIMKDVELRHMVIEYTQYETKFKKKV